MSCCHSKFPNTRNAAALVSIHSCSCYPRPFSAMLSCSFRELCTSPHHVGPARPTRTCCWLGCEGHPSDIPSQAGRCETESRDLQQSSPVTLTHRGNSATTEFPLCWQSPGSTRGHCCPELTASPQLLHLPLMPWSYIWERGYSGKCEKG